ncbi:MAG: hypothetical protein KDD38_00340 [Bdellovibrionales bacterium]|nr:hypothetical protein [Bdellovibrionales bacterium]
MRHILIIACSIVLLSYSPARAASTTLSDLNRKCESLAAEYTPYLLDKSKGTKSKSLKKSELNYNSSMFLAAKLNVVSEKMARLPVTAPAEFFSEADSLLDKARTWSDIESHIVFMTNNCITTANKILLTYIRTLKNSKLDKLASKRGYALIVEKLKSYTGYTLLDSLLSINMLKTICDAGGGQFVSINCLGVEKLKSESKSMMTEWGDKYSEPKLSWLGRLLYMWDKNIRRIKDPFQDINAATRYYDFSHYKQGMIDELKMTRKLQAQYSELWKTSPNKN